MPIRALKFIFLSIIACTTLGHGQQIVSADGQIAHNGHSDEVFSLCTIENDAFEAGEEIVYRIFYHWGPINLAAGEVIFKVEDADDKYRLVATGTTLRAFQWFYVVEDYFESLIDKESLLPERFIRNVQEGKFREYNKFIFDQEAQKVVAYGGKSIDNLKREDLDVNACMHDMLSILYYVRNLDFDGFEPGQSFPVEIFVEKQYPLTVRYLGEDEKRVRGMGKFHTHELSPEVIAGHVFKEKDQMHIWVTDDHNKLPVVIESPISVGKIRAFLHSYKGLRHDIESRVR